MSVIKSHISTEVVSTKPSPAIITTVVSAWSFLLTTMDLAMRKRWSGDVLNGQDLILISKSSDLQVLFELICCVLLGPGPNARVVYIDARVMLDTLKHGFVFLDFEECMTAW
ncbi:hypothetical protein Tco_1230823 [Tanacetum coccineum]